jgi:hypothetical protein
MYIYPLSRFHNISLVSAYFGLDKRECGCLEYYIIIIQDRGEYTKQAMKLPLSLHFFLN